MKKLLVIVISIAAILSLIWTVDAVAAAYPPALGGTGTTAAPAAGQVLVGTGSGVYTPAYILCAGTCSVSSASGTVTITGTGVATTTGNWAGTWQLYNPSDFVPSSTQIVNTVNGGSGTVTITSSTLGVIWPTINGNKSAAYNITATNGATSTVSGATTTISVSLNNGSAVTCSANQFLNTISATGTAACGSISFPTIPTYTYSAGNGISISQATSSSNTTTTITNTGVLSIQSSSQVIASAGTGANVQLTLAFNYLQAAIQALNGATSSDQTIIGTNGQINVSTVAGASNSTTTLSLAQTYLTAAIQTLAGISTSSISVLSGTGIGVATTTNSITVSNTGATSFNGQTGATTYTEHAGTGIAVSTSTTSSTITNIGVTSFTGAGCVTAANSTGTVSLAVTCISGNQSITFTINGDATGTASGATSITDSITVTGLNGKALPANTTGTLQFSAGAWKINLATSSLGVYDANGNLSSYLGSSCGGGEFVESISATGAVTCAAPPTSQTYTIAAGTGISTSVATSSSNATTTVTNTGVTSLNGATGTVAISSSSLGVIYNSSWATTTIQSVLNALSAAGCITYSSSTGQFGGTCISSSTGNTLYLQITNNLSDLNSTSTARTNLGLGSIATHPATDYLPSSTAYVSTFNGASGAVNYSVSCVSGCSATTSTTSTALTFTGGSGGIASSSPFTSGYLPVVTSTLTLSNSPIFVTLSTGDVTVGSTTDLGGPFNIVGSTPSIHIQYTGTGQYQGAGFQLGGPNSLGSQGTTYLAQQNLNNGATQGGFTMNQESATGTYIATVLTTNYASETLSLWGGNTDMLDIASSGITIDSSNTAPLNTVDVHGSGDFRNNLAVGTTVTSTATLNVSGTANVSATTTLSTASSSGAIYEEGFQVSTSTGGGGGASTSTSNTWGGTQTFTNPIVTNGISNTGNTTTTTETITGTSTAVSYQDITSSTPSFLANLDSYQYASPTLPSGFSEYGAYLNQLCSPNASGTTIFLPQGTLNISTTLNITEHCTYEGVGGNGTILNWTGNATGTIVNENWGTLPHVEGGGLEDLTLKGNNATTTASDLETCLLQGGGSGGSHGINDGLTIQGCSRGLSTATDTYMTILSNSTLVGDGTDIFFATSSNSGESLDFVNVKAVDPANGSATNCIYMSNNALENAVWIGGSIDDCQIYVANGNNITLEGVNQENPGYATYGAYTYINMASSFYGTVVDVIGGNMQNDSPASATAPTAFVNIGGNFYSWGVELARTTGAYAIPEYVNNTNSTSNGVAMVCNTLIQANSGNAVGSIFPSGNTTNTENNGCLGWTDNNYVQGVDYTGGGNTNFYQNGGIAAALQNSNKGWLNYGPMGFATTSVSVTNGTVVGSDDGGQITDTTSATSFVLTFPTHWSFNPVCTANVASGTPVAIGCQTTTSTATFKTASALPTSTIFSYIIQGNPN